ncbi:MAG: copper chaperone PCu(A)C [Pseudomonadota bacterium]
MRPGSRWIGAALLWLALPGLGRAQLTVEQPWVRATVAAQKASGAFMTLKAAENSRLAAASSPVAGVVELHEMSMAGQMMTMRQIAGLDLPAGQAVALKPGGYHIMLLDLKRQLKEGDSVPVTLLIDDAHGRRRTVTVNAVVRPLSAAGAAAPVSP